MPDRPKRRLAGLALIAVGIAMVAGLAWLAWWILS